MHLTEKALENASRRCPSNSILILSPTDVGWVLSLLNLLVVLHLNLQKNLHLDIPLPLNNFMLIILPIKFVQKTNSS